MRACVRACGPSDGECMAHVCAQADKEHVRVQTNSITSTHCHHPRHVHSHRGGGGGGGGETCLTPE